MPKSEYNLLPAFYDGLLEALPSGATLVDGFELAYAYKEPRQFAAGYRQIQEAVKISEVPDHYRTKVKAGFGLWIDYLKNPHYFTAEEFRQAVSAHWRKATDTSGFIVRSFGFFPPSGVERSHIEALAAARDANPVIKSCARNG